MTTVCPAFFDGSRWAPVIGQEEDPKDFELVGLASIEDLRKFGIPEDTKSVMLAVRKDGKAMARAAHG